MQQTDESIINAYCRGDREAFVELMRRYGDSVFGYLMRMSGSRERAEDLFQETFKRVYEKAHTFRGVRFKNWLFTIATRVAIDSLRRRKRLRLISLDQRADCDGDIDDGREAVAVMDTSCNPSSEVIKAEQTEQVRRAVAKLPEKQRATLVLAYYEQLSYSEVAEVMGCTVGTVKTQMFRALRTLAKSLPDISEGLQ